jgi:hypothetical protein
MSYDPDKIFGTSANSPAYDPDAIFKNASAEVDTSFVDPNIDSGDLGMSEDDFAPKPQEESEIGIMGAFKGAFENLGMLLSMPYGVAGGVAEAVKDTVTEVGTLAAGMNPFSDVKLSDSTMFDQSPVESAQGVASQFGDDMAQYMYLPQSEESAVVRDTVADAIPREAMQIAEALPPSGVALSATRNGIRMADDLIGDGSGAAGAAVRARGERIDANRQTLSGVSTGSKFMADEHIDMIESAPVEQKRLYSQIRDDSRSANNGAGATDRSSWSVVGDQFANRAEVLGEVGESYSRDMDKARASIKQMTDQGGVRTLTGDLQTEMTDFLKANRVKIDANGKLDFSDSAIFQGQGALQKAVRRFMSGTTTESGIGAGTMNYASFEDLHYLKQALQQAGYGAKRNVGAGDRSTQVIQNLSGMVNGTIRKISPEYANANDGLSSVIRSFEDLAGATKTDVSLGEADFTTGEWRKVAQNSRRMISNTDSGINMDQTLKDIDEVLLNESGKGANGNISPEQLKRLGFTPNSDGGFDQQVNLRQLALFANYMDILNGDGKPTAFKNLIAEANDRHFENLAANSIWGNQVGASAAAVKGLQQKFRTEASQMRKAGEVVEKTDKLRANIKSQVDEAIAEMLGREYQ